MKTGRTIALLTALPFLGPCVPLGAQEIPADRGASSVAQPGISSASFERLVNTFSWVGTLGYSGRSGAWDLFLDQNVRARLVRAGQSTIQREYWGTANLNYRLSPEWSPFLSLSSLILTDNRAIELGRTSVHSAQAGIVWMPLPNMRGSLSAGPEVNQQEDEVDKGFLYAATFGGSALPLDEFSTDLSLAWSESQIGRRKPHDGRAALAVVRDFSDRASDSLVVRYATQRRELYISASDAVVGDFGVSRNVFERRMDSLEVTNVLAWRIADDLQATVSGGLAGRSVDRRNRYSDRATAGMRIQESTLQGAADLLWMPFEGVWAQAGISHEEREERHTSEPDESIPLALQEKQTLTARRMDNLTSRTSVRFSSRMRISESDSLQLQSSASILRYDTPDTLNTDDRDELSMGVGLRYIHRFSRSLVLSVNASVLLSHLVYVSRYQSANNQWNRVVRLTPEAAFRPGPWMATFLRAEVLANYTVSDFEEQVAAVRSFSFRQASWSDSTVVRPARLLALTVTGSLRLTETGILHWKEFRERPEDYYVEKSLWPRIETDPGDWRFSLGYRFFSQDRYTYRNSRRMFVQEYSSAGPTAGVEWEWRGNHLLVLEGWREEQRVDGNLRTTIPNIRFTVAMML